MQMIGKTRTDFLLSTALCIGVGFGLLEQSAGAQASGQPVPPGVQNQTGTTGPCNNVDATGMPVNPNVSSCGAFAPGFAVPSTNRIAAPPRSVVAIVRVEALVQKPATAPFPMDYTAVGSATMIKAKMPRLTACFRVGKGLSDRSNAATSTTCLDGKGEVIAYQECKPKSGDAPMVCSTVTVKEPPDGTVANPKP